MPGYPNRCQHLKINGTQCGSPALRRNRFCFFHKRFQDERIRLNSDRARRGSPSFILPVLEDANSIQIALMQIMRLILTRQIDHKSASLLLYALQTASTNLRLTNFKPFQHEVILDPRDAANSTFASHLWDDEDFEEQEEDEQDADVDTKAERARQQAFQKQKKHEDTLRRYAAEHPDFRPFRDKRGDLQLEFIGSPSQQPVQTTPAPPAAPSAPSAAEAKNPGKKKPASEATPAEVRARISAMVREHLPAITKVVNDAKEKEEATKKDSQKQAT